MGDVKVPAAPQRVVVLDTAELDSVLTLGVKPVGATHADVESGFLNYLPKDQVAGITDVGQMMTPNLEAIAGLKPDLHPHQQDPARRQVRRALQDRADRDDGEHRLPLEGELPGPTRRGPERRRPRRRWSPTTTPSTWPT
ncbi:hypothetical protein SMICM17S_12196 [Streptomyces microflavus]